MYILFNLLVNICFLVYGAFVKNTIDMYSIAYRNRFDEKSQYYDWQEKYEWSKKQSLVNLFVFGLMVLKESGRIAYFVYINKIPIASMEPKFKLATFVLLMVLILTLRLESRLYRFRKMIM